MDQLKKLEENDEKPIQTTILPYKKRRLVAPRRVLARRSNIAMAFKSSKTIRDVFCHPKDPIESDLQSGTVHSIPCKDCSVSYIEETGRPVGRHRREYKAANRLGHMQKSAQAEHAIMEDYQID